MNQTLLALDLGSTIGVAEFAPSDDGGDWHTTSITFTGTRAERLSKLLTWLMTLEPRDIIVFERPFARGLAATRLLWGMAGVVELYAHDHGIACVDQVPSAVKKWATGKGTAKKEAMIDRAAELGYSDLNEHAADALLLGMYALDNLEITHA